MPIGSYYRGRGESVMSDMKDRYGAEKGKRVFYATAQKRHMAPEDSAVKKSMRKAMQLKKRVRSES